jgi:hypothetical protein
MSCPNTPRCPLFPQFKLKPSLDFWLVRFCNSDQNHPDCERFKMSKAGKSVPPKMLPNGKSLA